MRILPFHYAARNLGRSRLRLAMSIGGSALVVLLIVAAAAFARGMNRALAGAGEERNIILLGAGSEESIERSEVNPGAAGVVAASVPGLRAHLGTIFASPEVHVGVPLTAHADEQTNNLVLVRAVTPAAMLVHSRVQIVEGRLPSPGTNEIMLGRLVAARIGLTDEQVKPGAKLYLDGHPWTVVGRFVASGESGGSLMEAEVWATLSDILVAMKRTTHSCVVVTLEEAELADVDAFAKQRLDLELVAMSEREYYSTLGAFFRPVRYVAWATAALIAIGGLFGGLNTMYAAFASRVRELGMLRCLGYRRGAIVVSLVQESLLATATGALAASAAAVLLLNGLTVRFAMGAFSLIVDAPVLLAGLGAGLLLGLVGALPPAMRALRMPIPESLKAL